MVGGFPGKGERLFQGDWSGDCAGMATPFLRRHFLGLFKSRLQNKLGPFGGLSSWTRTASLRAKVHKWQSSLEPPVVKTGKVMIDLQVSALRNFPVEYVPGHFFPVLRNQSSS